MKIVRYRPFGSVVMLMLIFAKIVHFKCLFGLHIYLILFTIPIFCNTKYYSYVNIIILANKDISVKGNIIMYNTENYSIIK